MPSSQPGHTCVRIHQGGARCSHLKKKKTHWISSCVPQASLGLLSTLQLTTSWNGVDVGLSPGSAVLRGEFPYAYLDSNSV